MKAIVTFDDKGGITIEGDENAVKKAYEIWNPFNTRPNPPQSSEVDVCHMCKGTGGVQEYFDGMLESSMPCPKCQIDYEQLQDDLQQVISDTHDIDVHDEDYARNIVEHLKEKGYLKTPAENVRCDGALKDFELLLDIYQNHIEESLEGEMPDDDETVILLKQCRDNIRAALQKPKAAWLPIETCPDEYKDGRTIMLKINEEECIGGFGIGTNDTEKSWCGLYDGMPFRYSTQPTHYRLPQQAKVKDEA